MKPERSVELEAILTRWLRALEHHDIGTLSNLISPSEQTRYIGSDEHEMWSGSVVSKALGTHMGELPEFEFEILEDSVEAYSLGAVGWGAAVFRFTVEGLDPVVVRNTSVFVLEDGVWKAIQVHNSAPRANEDAIGVTMTRTLDELLGAIGESGEAEITDLSRQGVVTLVFTDIEASTSTAASVGDDRWAELVEWHDGRIADITRAHGGSVIKSLGDGSMLSFGSTRGAASAAIAIQHAMAGDDAPIPIAVRIGVHSGDVVQTESDLIGNTVNAAARVTSAAGGREILTSSVVYGMLVDSNEFSFGQPRKVRLDGYDRDYDLYPLDWVGSA